MKINATPRAGHRFGALDGLRGAAALSVVAYHVGTALGLPRLAPRGYLAVDFFFVLSGFVLAHRYESELIKGRLTAFAFLRLRFVRLWPLAFVGTLIGTVAILISPTALDPDAGGPHIFALVAAAVLLIPNLSNGVGLFPLDPPLWSVAFELAGNFFYAVAIHRLTDRMLGLIVGFTGIGLIVVTVRMNTANSPDPLRLFFSFFAGVLLYRVWLLRARRSRSRAALPVGVALIGTLFIGEIPGINHGATDSAIILTVFPALIWGGAAVAVSGDMERACQLVGEASYPLYAIHYPILMASLAVVATRSTASAVFFVIAETVFLWVFAITLSRFYDRPVRGMLSHFLGRFTPAAS